jgi:hypothetical protein
VVIRIRRREVGGWAPVIHTCNPSYLGDRVQYSRIAVPGQPRQKVNETLISTNNLNIVVCLCDPIKWEG